MKRNIFIITVIVIILILALSIFKKFSSQDQDMNKGGKINTSDSVVITSDDKSFTLTVPLTALPDGVSGKDIKINRESLQTAEEVSGDSGVEYFLLPDGLEFKKEVKFMATETYVPGKTSVFLHKSDKEVEMLEVEKVLSVDGKSVTYTGEINHFSRIAQLSHQHFEVELEEVGNQAIDSPFFATYNIRKLGYTHLWRGADNALIAIVASPDPWKITEGTFRVFSRNVYPPEVTNPKEETEVEEDSYTGRELFECQSEGHASIGYAPRLEWTADWYYLDSGEWLTEDEEEIESFADFAAAAGGVLIGMAGGAKAVLGDYYGVPTQENEESGIRQVSAGFNCLAGMVEVSPTDMILEEDGTVVQEMEFEVR